MTNKLGMVGKGTVTNGVITFMDATGKGFAKSVSHPVIRREPVIEFIEEEVEMEEIVLDVPEFMKNRKPAPVEEKVIYVNFSKEKEEEEEGEHPFVEGLLDVLGKARKVLVNNPVFKYFIDDHEQVRKEDK
jgi:hypothetical protein